MGRNILRVDRLHDLGALPQLPVKHLNLRTPLHVGLNSLGGAVLVDWRWQCALVILHLQQSDVD
jgi:hypothetical protein